MRHLHKPETGSSVRS